MGVKSQDIDTTTIKRLHEVDEDIIDVIKNIASIVKTEHKKNLSPQIIRKLERLLQINNIDESSFDRVLHLIAGLVDRLILELVQAQYDTKRREGDFLRLAKLKKCYISNPKLTDLVIVSLIRLYKVACHCSDTFVERNVLIGILLKQLSEYNCNKNHIAKVVQTLYWSECFEINKMERGSAKLMLKQGLTTAEDVRMEHDRALINLAYSNHIRLNPKSWSFILYNDTCQNNQSYIQSILDKFDYPVTIEELKINIERSGDKFNLSHSINDLDEIMKLHRALMMTNKQGDKQQILRYEYFRALVYKLNDLKDLFLIRQSRNKIQ